MLNNNILILNFDDSLTPQKGLARHKVDMVDLKDMGPQARFWVSNKDKLAIEKRIPARTAGAITFLGSGDFHHISETLIARHDEPVSVIDFDFHPDWDIVFPMLHCGSWASRVMKTLNVPKLVMVGPASRDMSPFSMHTGDLGSLKDDRIEIYPYSRKPASVFFRSVPPNISFETKKYPFLTRVSWNELRKKNIMEFFMHVIKRLPTKKVYVTVDKDCLGTGDALTNWDQGSLPLDDLLLMLKMIKDNLDIVGMDITGDYSPIGIDGIFKRLVARLDHPKNVTAAGLPASRVTEVNERTNLKILDLMTS